MKIAFFGSSLVSSYWNGAATYYRGLLKELAALGHRVTFYEPDAFERQQHRDIAEPAWAKVVVYPGSGDAWQVPKFYWTATPKSLLQRGFDAIGTEKQMSAFYNWAAHNTHAHELIHRNHFLKDGHAVHPIGGHNGHVHFSI